MSLFSLALAIIGLGGWTYVWISKSFMTSGKWYTQIAMMLFGVMWLSLILADTAQHLDPTTGTLFARIVLLAACALITPVLKTGDKS